MVCEKQMALNLVDKLTLLYLILVGGLIIAFGENLPYFHKICTIHLLTILALLIFYFVTYKFNLKFIRDWYLIIIVTFLYEETGYLNQMIFHGFWDNYISVVEHAVFNCDLGKIMVSRFNSFLINEIMYFFYFSYYLIIPVLGVIIYFKKGRKEFHLFLFTLMLTYYVCYILYIFIPIAGPFEYENVRIKGFFFDRIIHFFYKHGELPGSAMPSSHVAIALVVLIYSKIFRIGFPIFLLIFTMLTISTMYLRYHYFLDVEAGIITGIICFSLSIDIIGRKKTIHF
jgi:membrane-associated phospholipid phosphatase